MKEDIFNPLEEIGNIRQLMDRSSRFISLSGLSGVFAGIYALIGAGFAYWFLTQNSNSSFLHLYNHQQININLLTFCIVDAGLVLLFSITTGIWFTNHSAKKNKQTIWDKSAQRLVINLAIPIVVGGVFCLAMIFHQLVGLIAPVMLIFYGLGLINASKYTHGDVRQLGILEVILGLISSFFIGYGLLFWSIGFGFLHIVYGVLMYYKYEK